VDKCSFDSDKSRTEIIEIIINFYRSKLIFPNDPSRILPPFIENNFTDSKLEDDSEKSEAHEEMNIFAEETSKIAITKPVTAWIIDLITAIQKNSVPDELKEDILSRDLIFESQLKLRNNSLASKTYNESELENWLLSLSEEGYTPQKYLKNPLNGVKIILSSMKNKFILSIALNAENDFVCVMYQLF